MSFYQHETAVVDAGAQIGDGSKVWHFAHVCSGAVIGENCVFGQNTMVAPDVKVGNNVKVQNNVAIYTGAVIEDDVFLGPSCVLTNVTNPRSQVVRRDLYERTLIRRGATISANATIVCGITLGRYCFIAAGATVTRDVPDYALVMGLPARQTGWMSRHGHPLKFGDDDIAICPESGLRYKWTGRCKQQPFEGQVCCLDVSEDDALSTEHSVGKDTYASYKQADTPALAKAIQ